MRLESFVVVGMSSFVELLLRLVSWSPFRGAGGGLSLPSADCAPQWPTEAETRTVVAQLDRRVQLFLVELSTLQGDSVGWALSLAPLDLQVALECRDLAVRDEQAAGWSLTPSGVAAIDLLLAEGDLAVKHWDSLSSPHLVGISFEVAGVDEPVAAEVIHSE